MQSAKLRKKFRFIPDIATADLAFEAFGKDYNKLFENAGFALESAMVDLTSLKVRKIKDIKLEKDSVENLLSSFLEELVFLKDSEQLLFKSIKCFILKADSGKWTLIGKLGGESIDRERHILGADVKAVTKHLFKIETHLGNLLCCRVVLDV